jgi:hypothetical protein
MRINTGDKYRKTRENTGIKTGKQESGVRSA